ncbi:MAG: MFS transporter [Firmicutes bacterium HGW-Firmicutes-9]|jgi:DHA3 family macrolide efflux protein-like MFS transporter|nr:MAG: MFS transporter [Firmicutes bacterium HGW-Firmicutes-9]
MEQSPTWKRRTILFFISQGITLFGSMLVQFAIVWYVTLKTASGAWVAALTVCSFLPQTLISFVSGAWADRYSKKMLIIVSDTVIALATLALALLFPLIREDANVMLALLVVSAIRSIGSGVQLPAVNATTPMLVPEDQLMRFNGINATLQSIIQFAAPAASGALLTLGGLRATLFIDIATAVVGIGLLSCIALPRMQQQPEEPQSVFADVQGGLSYIRKEGFLAKLILLYGVFILLSVPGGFLASLLVTRVYGANYWYLTMVELIGFAGMAAGGILLSVWGGFPNRVKTLLLGIGLCGLCTIGLGAVNNFIVYLGIMLLLGVCLTAAQTSVTTLIQERADVSMHGRVFGLMGAMYSGFLLIGMSVFGPLADVVSLPLMMILSGALLAVIALLYRVDHKFYQKPE